MSAERAVEIPLEKPIVLFDGVCNFCASSVQFIIQRDKGSQLRFASLQSDVGRELLTRFGLPADKLDSMVLIENGRAYTESSAGLRIARRLDRGWPLLYGFVVVPRFLRNAVYRGIARNRYRWFGKKDSCMIPTPEVRARFLSS